MIYIVLVAVAAVPCTLYPVPCTPVPLYPCTPVPLYPVLVAVAAVSVTLAVVRDGTWSASSRAILGPVEGGQAVGGAGSWVQGKRSYASFHWTESLQGESTVASEDEVSISAKAHEAMHVMASTDDVPECLSPRDTIKWIGSTVLQKKKLLLKYAPIIEARQKAFGHEASSVESFLS